MSCPTCASEMQSIHNSRAGLWWCPRCGTVKITREDGACVPKLVERCRQFEKEEIAGCVSRKVDKWQQLGIAESINPPEQGEPPP